ncbi:hypothetical protein REPUB_Repub10bG0150200 [Reevesia pubescens]
MIQELLGGAAGGLSFGGERKISVRGNILEGTPAISSPSPSPSNSSTTSSTTTNSNTASANNSENQNLRCPRCDSSNTKFCYYNNYNLTQPRHFCKTCRRYWTKGGALRNVPIGGGCRKNKNTIVSTSVGKSTAAAAKMKTVVSEIGRSSFGNGFDHDLQPSPILWASPHHSSHLLALLRNTQNPNPNTFSSNPVNIKEEVSLLGSHVMNEPGSVATTALNARTLGFDPLSCAQAPSLGLCSPFWKTNQHQATQQQQQNNNGSFLLGEVQNTGIQELYQRLKLSSSSYYSDSSAVVLSNVGSSSSSSILESAPVAAAGELGYWNPAFSTSSWSDLPTTNDAYP